MLRPLVRAANVFNSILVSLILLRFNEYTINEAFDPLSCSPRAFGASTEAPFVMKPMQPIWLLSDLLHHRRTMPFINGQHIKINYRQIKTVSRCHYANKRRPWTPSPSTRNWALKIKKFRWNIDAFAHEHETSINFHFAARILKENRRPNANRGSNYAR